MRVCYYALEEALYMLCLCSLWLSGEATYEAGVFATSLALENTAVLMK